MSKLEQAKGDMVSRETVYQAAVGIYEAGKVVTRERLSDVLDIPSVKLDEHIRMLRDAKRLRTIERGVFEPVFDYPPPRVMSKTILRNGFQKVDIGDLLLEFSPEEARMLGHLMYSDAIQYTEIQSSKEARQLIFDLGVKLRELMREVACLRDKRNKLQMDLLTGPEERANADLLGKARHRQNGGKP